MRTVGHRLWPELAARPSGERLRAAAAINEPLAKLLPGGRIAAPKGIFRFRTLDDANRQQQSWLAEAMAEAQALRAE
jgi:hypothetical protein